MATAASVLRLACALAAMAACALVAAGCASTRPAPAGAPFSFALLGDAPYGDAGERRFAALLRQIDDDASVRFVLHAGDLKGGGEPCSDALLDRRLAQLRSVRTAIVYTPGDNDWTDCHRAAAGAFDPLERLAALRRLAYPDPGRAPGQQPLLLQRQSASAEQRQFVENVRFVHEGVVFVTLHVVGSGNGLEPWRGIDDRVRVAAFEARQAANLAWLEQAFAHARSVDAAAVVVLMHASPGLHLSAGDPRRAPYRQVVAALKRLATGLARPVLLAHGDRHLFFVDRPFGGDPGPRPDLTRVQAPGEPLPGWVRVDVDPGRPGVFRITAGGREGVHG